MRQNLTLSLDKQLIRKLRVIAAHRATSISGIVGQELQRIVEENERFELARRQALSLLDSGLHLGGRPASREALYDRKTLR